MKKNRLTIVIENYEKRNKLWHSLCLCDCGTEKIISRGSIRRGVILSCGCLMREVVRSIHKTHNLSYTRIYYIYKGIVARTTNPKNKSFSSYGGRGVKNTWSCFEDFYKDMGQSYKQGLSIDRIDVNGDYSKENCRWITMKEQARNKRNNVFFNGETLTEAAKRHGCFHGVISKRIHLLGWSIQEAFTKPVRENSARLGIFRPFPRNSIKL